MILRAKKKDMWRWVKKLKLISSSLRRSHLMQPATADVVLLEHLLMIGRHGASGWSNRTIQYGDLFNGNFMARAHGVPVI